MDILRFANLLVTVDIVLLARIFLEKQKFFELVHSLFGININLRCIYEWDILLLVVY